MQVFVTVLDQHTVDEMSKKYFPWEKRHFGIWEHCVICNKKLRDEEYVYRKSEVDASENTWVEYACRDCVEKNG